MPSFPQTLAGDPWVLLIQALVCQRTDRQKEATAIVDELIRDIPDFPRLTCCEATLYRDANHPAEAVPGSAGRRPIQDRIAAKPFYELARALNQSAKSGGREGHEGGALAPRTRFFSRDDTRISAPVNISRGARRRSGWRRKC